MFCELEMDILRDLMVLTLMSCLAGSSLLLLKTVMFNALIFFLLRRGACSSRIF